MTVLNSDGTVDLIYNGTPVLTHFLIPGYAPQLGGRFPLGARTGGEFASHSIDDFAVQLDIDPTNGVPRITSVATNGTGGLTILGAGTPGATLVLNAATKSSKTIRSRPGTSSPCAAKGIASSIEGQAAVETGVNRENGEWNLSPLFLCFLCLLLFKKTRSIIQG